MALSKIKKIRLGKFDRLWSKIARNETPYCEYCRVTQGLNAHHFKGRSCKATRLMMENAVILCASHHVFNHLFSAHKTPEVFERWFKETFPERHRAIIKKAQTMLSEREAIKEFNEQIRTKETETSQRV
jgi:hypothetical protein